LRSETEVVADWPTGTVLRATVVGDGTRGTVGPAGTVEEVYPQEVINKPQARKESSVRHLEASHRMPGRASEVSRFKGRMAVDLMARQIVSRSTRTGGTRDPKATFFLESAFIRVISLPPDIQSVHAEDSKM
jgi:hypothetical protein